MQTGVLGTVTLTSGDHLGGKIEMKASKIGLVSWINTAAHIECLHLCCTTASKGTEAYCATAQTIGYPASGHAQAHRCLMTQSSQASCGTSQPEVAGGMAHDW